MKASREIIKMKTPEGEVKVAVIGDSPGTEEYLQHINNFIRMLGRKKIEEDMLKLAKAVIGSKAQVRKLKTAPQGEKPAEKTARLVLLKAATKKLVEAEVCEDAKLATVYDLFCKTLKEDLELQWDHIVKDMHAKDFWEDLKGIKHGRIHMTSEAAPCPLQPCYFDKWDFFADMWDCHYAVGFPVCIFMYLGVSLHNFLPIFPIS